MQQDSNRIPASDAFELERFLPYGLSLLANTVSQGIAASYRDEFGISVAEWRILAVLGRSTAQTASDLVRRTAMDKVTIHRAVKSLIDKGLLRHGADHADRRRRPLNLTASGRQTVDAIIPRARAFEHELLEALNPAEAEALSEILRKLTDQAFLLARSRQNRDE